MINGCEAWNLDSATMASINGINARCLSRITGKSAHEEASARTRTYDLVRAIRVRRLKWLGHILRMTGERLVKMAVRRQWQLGIEGNIFMDVPAGLTYTEVVALAQDRKAWKELTMNVEGSWVDTYFTSLSTVTVPPSQHTLALSPRLARAHNTHIRIRTHIHTHAPHTDSMQTHVKRSSLSVMCALTHACTAPLCGACVCMCVRMRICVLCASLRHYTQHMNGTHTQHHTTYGWHPHPPNITQPQHTNGTHTQSIGLWYPLSDNLTIRNE